jgi:hypothetical protein
MVIPNSPRHRARLAAVPAYSAVVPPGQREMPLYPPVAGAGAREELADFYADPPIRHPAFTVPLPCRATLVRLSIDHDSRHRITW